MELLKVLAMPFQVGSLLFVAASSLLLGLVISMGVTQLTLFVLSIHVILMMLIWLTNYSVRLIDDAANGVRESSAASAEMLADPYLDSRCWVHPLIAVALGAMHYLHPAWPVWPTLLAAVLLFPASMGACVMSGHALDALNPAKMLQVVRGLGGWYLLVVLFIALCAMLGVTLARQLQLGAVLIASEQLLLLIVYAALGGAIYERRFELGFEPRVSPERKADNIEAARIARRQQFLDGLYNDLRMRKSAQAIASVRQWLQEAQPDHRVGDLHAILAACRSWNEPREFARLLQGLVAVLLEVKQPPLAYTAAEAGLASGAFAPAEETHAVALADYALATGRRRGAAQLLDNFLQRAGAAHQPGPQFQALRARLQQNA